MAPKIKETPKPVRERAVENAVTLNIRMGLPQLKKDLMVPYPSAKLANDVFLRALGTINLLERDAARMRELIKLVERRDAEHSLFDCPSGGLIRQEIKQILALTTP